MKFFLRVVRRKLSPLHGSSQNSHHKKLKSSRKLRAGIKRLKRDMVKISEDHKAIKESQSEVRMKLEEIKDDCEFIKNEAEQITQLSEITQRRLDLMFMIMEARKNKDFLKANIHSRSLRLLLVTASDGQQNDNHNADDDNGKALEEPNASGK